jgi:peptide/nickel transport system substrate-binding protein
VFAAAAILAAGALHAAAAGGQLSIALQGDFPSLDASKDSSPIGYNVRLNVYDSLTEIAADGSVAPRLATKWQPSDDAKVWTFTIRDGVKFQDGEPLTVDDVVWTYQKILDDKTSPVRTWVSIVDKVEKVDEHSVRFTLKRPFGIFDRQTTYVFILPRKAYEKMGEQAFAQKPIGSGPYKVKEWRKDDRLVLEANHDYWRGEPALETGIFRPIPSEASRAAALLSGDVDIVPVLPASLLAQVRNAAGLKVGTANSFRVMFLGFNVNFGELGDLKLRQAIDKAIDRKALTAQLLRGIGSPAAQIVPPVDFGYDAALQPTTYDPEAAKALVKQSGYKGEPIPFQYPSNNLAMANEVAQAIAGYLSAVGIKVELQPMEYTAFFPEWAHRKMKGMYFFAFGSSMFDADSSMVGLYEEGSRIYQPLPEIDKLAKEQRSQTDPEKRKAIFANIFKLSQEKLPYVPLYNEMQAYGVRDGIKWTPRPDGYVRLYDIQPPAQ